MFPNQKLSYWADSPITARAEIKKHGAGNNILTFWAYDDGTSTFPTLQNQEPLIIIDGRKCGVQDLLDKADNGMLFTKTEQDYMASLLAQEPDCLVFDSHAKKGGENFIFFEKGFQKLSLRQLRLRFGKRDGGNYNLNETQNSVMILFVSKKLRLIHWNFYEAFMGKWFNTKRFYEYLEKKVL